MKVKVYQVVNAVKVFDKLLESDFESYSDMRLLKKLGKLLTEESALAEEKKNSLIKKLGKQDGDNFIISPEDNKEAFTEFNKFYNDMMNTEVDLNVEMFNEKILVDNKIKLSIKDSILLEPFMTPIED